MQIPPEALCVRLGWAYGGGVGGNSDSRKFRVRGWLEGSLEFGAKGLTEILKDLEPVFIAFPYLSMQHASALCLALLSIHGVLSVDDAGCGRGHCDGLRVQRL